MPRRSARTTASEQGTSTDSSRSQSTNSGGRSKSSKRQWRRPSNVAHFTAQALDVARLVLKGELDLETGKVYASIARTAAQTITSQVMKARFLNKEPDLTFTYEDDE